MTGILVNAACALFAASAMISLGALLLDAILDIRRSPRKAPRDREREWLREFLDEEEGTTPPRDP